MLWTNIEKTHLIGLECVNGKTNKHILRLSPNSKNVISSELQNEDTRYVSIKVNYQPTLHDIQQILLDLQKKYDNDFEINHFIINGKNVWLDKATRVGLFSILNIEKANSTENITIWFKDTSIEISVDKAITLLTEVEKYAKQCYDNTQKHYFEIKQLKSIEECLNYDITSGYPNILNITIEN